MASPASVRVIRDPRAATAVLHPMRLKILEHLASPDSASGVSRHLRVGRQKVNYHLRLLEARGLLRLVGERRVGSCTERLLQTVADSFVLSPRMLGRVAADRTVGPAAPAQRLLAAAARIEREVGGARENELRAGAVHALEVDVRLPSDEAARAFTSEVASLLRGLAARYGSAAPAPTHHVLVAVHPRASVHSSLRDPRAPDGEGR